jgi:hypothetical protein
MSVKRGRSEARKSGQEEKLILHPSGLLLFLTSSVHGFKKGLSDGRPFLMGSVSHPVPAETVSG